MKPLSLKNLGLFSMCLLGCGQDVFPLFLDVMHHMCIPMFHTLPPPPPQKCTVVIHFTYICTNSMALNLHLGSIQSM